MKVILVQVFLCVLLIERKLWLTSCSAHCSCYTFHDVTDKRWSKANDECKTRNGTLVSMETEDEWNFITNEILQRNTTSSYDNEWFIGLRTLRNEANWTWISGQRLTISSKWQPNEPNNWGGIDKYFCVAMAKNWPKGKHGYIKDVQCTQRYPYICEYDAGTRVSPSLNPVCWSNSSSKIRLTSCSEVVPHTTGKIPEETTRTTQVNNMKPTTIITTTPMSSQPTVPTVVTTVKASSETFRQTDKPSYVFIIVIVLVVLVIVLIVLFIAVCCRLRKKKGKSSFKERSPLTAQTSISSRQFSTKLGEPSHTAPEQVIYAEVNNKTTPHPTTTYDNAQEYQDPVDSLPSSPTQPDQPDMYSTINEANEEHNVYREPLNEASESTATANAYEAIANNGPNAGAAAMYAVVDKSKKTKKKAGDAMATDNNNLQEEAKVQYPNDASAQQSSPEVTAVYAAVDKSKKSKGKKAGVAIATANHNLQNEEKSKIHNDTSAQQGSTEVAAMYAVVDKSKKSKGKKAGVSMATMDQNEANDYQNNVPSDENPPEIPALYEALEDKPKEMKERIAGVDVPAENYNQTEAYADNEILNLYAEVDDSMKRKQEM